MTAGRSRRPSGRNVRESERPTTAVKVRLDADVAEGIVELEERFAVTKKAVVTAALDVLGRVLEGETVTPDSVFPSADR